MSKPSGKKIKKEKARREKLKRRTTQDQHRRKRDEAEAQFPDFIIEAETAPEALVQKVEQAAQHVARYHEELFDAGNVKALHLGKVMGFKALSRRAKVVPTGEGLDDETYFPTTLSTMVGEAVLRAIPESVFDSYFPYHNIFIMPDARRANALTLMVRSLEQAKTPGGTAYYSPQKPTVETPHAHRVVGFYRHAVQRVCERTVRNWKSYAGMNDAFAYLHDCVYYEPWHDGERLGFTLYEHCTPFTSDYVDRILGKEHEKANDYYHCVGYCPAVEAGELLVATTLLSPGMHSNDPQKRNTPEYDWYMQTKGGGYQVRGELEARVSKLTFAELARTRDFSLLKEFHDGGIPQIVRLKHEVFRHLFPSETRAEKT